MQLTALFGALLALVASVVAQASDPSITSPSLTECQPASFTVSGTAPPFLIAVLPGGQPSAPAVAFLPNVNAAGAFTWNVNLPAGSNITMRVTDARGMIGYSSPLVIQQGQTSACVTGSASVSQAAGSTATGATIPGSSTTGTTSRPASGTTPTNSSPNPTTPVGASTSSPAATTTTRSGASSNYVAGSAFGLIGAAVLALMA